MWGMTPPPAIVACTNREGQDLRTGFDGFRTARTEREGRAYLDESIKLLVTTDGQLEMAGRDTLDLQAGRGG